MDKKEALLSCTDCGEKFEKEASLKLHEEHCEAEEKDEMVIMKEEIIKELSASKKNKKQSSWGNVAVTSVLAFLLLFSVAQTVQSANILSKIESGKIKTSSPAAAASATLPANVQNLPDMVGGC